VKPAAFGHRGIMIPKAYPFLSDWLSFLPMLSKVIHQRRGAADCGEYREAAGAI
jgi:hypothetical protein